MSFDPKIPKYGDVYSTATKQLVYAGVALRLRDSTPSLKD